jgi:MipA family protein
MTYSPAIVAILLTALHYSAFAQANAAAAEKSDWRLSAGVAVIAAPKYVGSEKTKISLLPAFDARYKDWFFISPVDGIGAQTKLTEGLTASAALGLSFDKRRTKDSPRFAGLSDVKESPALIVSLDYKLGEAFLNTDLRSRLGGESQRGSLVSADLGYTVGSGQWGALSAGVTAKAMDDTYARNFFGVSAIQSAASGLPVHHASGGLQRSGLFVQGAYRISADWTLLGRLEVARLANAASRSPIVEEKRQNTVVFSALRSF